MTITLYGSQISTFSRKIAVALDLKELPFEYVDALTPQMRDKLREANPRIEVPVLFDAGITVINSSDIIQYLDQRYPERPLLPSAIPDRVVARAFERLGDQRFDPIVVDCSYWHWGERSDTPPDGLLNAAQADLDILFDRLEAMLRGRPKPWPFGAPGVVECAWFPNLAAMRTFGLSLDTDRFHDVAAWSCAIRKHPVFVADAHKTAAFLKEGRHLSHERRKLFWSGDRLEWLISRGFHDWFLKEIEAGRAAFPGCVSGLISARDRSSQRAAPQPAQRRPATSRRDQYVLLRKGSYGSRGVRKLYHSHLSPYARRVLIVLTEKQLEHEREKHTFARDFAKLSSINPCLLLPVFMDGDVCLWGSNLINEYLLQHYPNVPPNSPDPPLAETMTRPDRHWEDARVLATLETMTDSIMNLRQMKMSGLEPEQVVYLRRQRDRIDRCLDWLDTRATADGFVPGAFSIMDLNLICALGNVDRQKSFEWRGRPNLEALVARHADRPSVELTAPE
jgi:glutathione S-transferase